MLSVHGNPHSSLNSVMSVHMLSAVGFMTMRFVVAAVSVFCPRWSWISTSKQPSQYIHLKRSQGVCLCKCIYHHNIDTAPRQTHPWDRLVVVCLWYTPENPVCALNETRSSQQMTLGKTNLELALVRKEAILTHKKTWISQETSMYVSFMLVTSCSNLK